MEKILTIDGRQVPFKSTGAFLLRYKAQFHRDALGDIFKMNTMDPPGKEDQFKIAWALAKTANPKIPPPDEWLDTFKTFPMDEIMPDLEEMIFTCLCTTVKSNKSLATEDSSFDLTTEIIMLRAIERGLQLRDFEIMSIGMILGYIFTYDNDKDEDDVKAASQADIDKF